MMAGEVEDVNESRIDMPSFVSSTSTTGENMQNPQFPDLRSLEQSMGFRMEEVSNMSRNSPLGSQQIANNAMEYGSFSKQPTSNDIPTSTRVGSLSFNSIENWGDSTMPTASASTDTSTDVDTDEKNQQL